MKKLISSYDLIARRSTTLHSASLYLQTFIIISMPGLCGLIMTTVYTQFALSTVTLHKVQKGNRFYYIVRLFAVHQIAAKTMVDIWFLRQYSLVCIFPSGLKVKFLNNSHNICEGKTSLIYLANVLGKF